MAVGAGTLALHYLTGEAMMLASAWGRVVLPLGKVEREANVPGADHAADPVRAPRAGCANGSVSSWVGARDLRRLLVLGPAASRKKI
jgi:hypothetical protein